jgi:hypothetical protein
MTYLYNINYKILKENFFMSQLIVQDMLDLRVINKLSDHIQVNF